MVQPIEIKEMEFSQGKKHPLSKVKEITNVPIPVTGFRKFLSALQLSIIKNNKI